MLTQKQRENNPSRGKIVNRNRPRVEPRVQPLVETNGEELQNNCSQYINGLMERGTNFHEQGEVQLCDWDYKTEPNENARKKICYKRQNFLQLTN